MILNEKQRRRKPRTLFQGGKRECGEWQLKIEDRWLREGETSPLRFSRLKTSREGNVDGISSFNAKMGNDF